MANTDKTLSASVSTSALFLREIGKHISVGLSAGTSIVRGTGKHNTANVSAGASTSRGVGKNVAASVNTGPTVKKSIGKNINASVTLTATKDVSAATITLVYNGNAELGLGAQEGTQFNVIVTGTFSTFTIAMNGKTLTYTEDCTDQTITIDNVNATVKNGTTNKLSKVTGDVADFLKLIPGDNVITYTKTGSNVDFTFDFSPIFI